MANEPTFNPNAYRDVRRRRAAQPRGAGPLRAGLDVQGRDGVGGARGARHAVPTRSIDTNPGSIRFGSAGRSTRTAIATTACCRSPTSSSSRATSARSRSAPASGTERLEPLRRALRLRPAGVAGLSRREPGHRLERRQAGPTARWRRCRWAIRSASRRCRWRRRSARWPTAASWSSRASCARSIATTGAWRSRRRSCAARSSATRPPTLTTIMEQRRRARHRASARRCRLHGRRQDRHGREARQRPLLAQRLQRVVRRLRPVAQPGAHDRRRDRLAAGPNGDHGGTVAAPIFKRIAEAALRYLGVAPT